jgi:hypothetical protein
MKKGRRHFRAAAHRDQNSLVLKTFDPPAPILRRLSQFSRSVESKMQFRPRNVASVAILRRTNERGWYFQERFTQPTLAR